MKSEEARMKSATQMQSPCGCNEIPPPAVEADFIPEGDFIIEDDFIHPTGWISSRKAELEGALLNLSKPTGILCRGGLDLAND